MPPDAPRIGAIVLAAGLGRRFGPAPKLLALHAGRPLVRHAAEAALASAAAPVRVVLGAQAPRLRAALTGLALDFVENPDPARGLASSLRLGLAGFPMPAPDAVIVLLADMPGIAAAHLDALAAAYRTAAPRPAAVVPTWAGRRGNPVLLDLARLQPALATLTGDRGAGTLLREREDVLELPLDAAVLYDVDTPGALHAPPGA